ncbi:MAG TPA: hypothetical protein ENI94_06710 [Gammaproteobacteria bacterium]|nr:hypothetical protein [Gammaproteobacteria bacterium]
MSEYRLIGPGGVVESLDCLPTTREAALALLQAHSDGETGTYQFQEIMHDERYAVDRTRFSFTRYETGEWGLSQWLSGTPIVPLKQDVILYATDIKPLLGGTPAYAELGGDAEYAYLWLNFLNPDAESIACFTIIPDGAEWRLHAIENQHDLYDGIPITATDTRNVLLIAELITRCWLGHPTVCLHTGSLNQEASTRLFL